MRLKPRHFVVVSCILLALLLLAEATARILLRPNRIELETTHPVLLETTWDQVGEYARFVTLDDDAGCWATAIAQIAHHHRIVPRGRVEYVTSHGDLVNVDLESAHFDHSLFPTHIADDTPEASSEQVAMYIYFVAAILHTDFGGSGYLDHQTFVERVESHLDTEVGFHEFDKESYLQRKDEIATLVRAEIAADRPMMIYFDNGDDFGHAAVIDGVVSEGAAILVHLNMGWGGKYDGWYDLFDRFMGFRDDLQTRFLVTIRPREVGLAVHSGA